MQRPTQGRVRVPARYSLFLALLLLNALSLPLWPAAAAPPGAIVEEVVVRGLRLDPVEASAVPLSRVDQGSVSDSLPLLPTDWLRGVPGVFAQQTTPGQGAPILRGLKGSQVLHLVDGFRLNNAFFRSAPNQFLALVPTAQLEAADVARGPVGTLYGSDAMGGVLQLHTRQPRFERVLRTGGSLAWQSSTHALDGALAVAGGTARHAMEAGITLSDVGDRRTASGRVTPSAYESRGGWLRTRHRGNLGEWGVSAQWMEQPRTPRVDELVPGFGQAAPASSEFFFEPNRRQFLQLTAAPRMDSPLADSLSLQLGWQRIDDDRRNREYQSNVRSLERNASELWGLSATATRYAGDLRLRYGMDLYRDDIRSERIETNLIDGDTAGVAARFPDGSRMDSLGVFADGHWAWSSTGSIEAGLRYSRFDIEVADTAFGAPGTQLGPDDVSARLGITQQLSGQVSLSLGLGQGFRAPNIYDLSALGPRPGNRFNVASPSLAPEQVTSYDLGLRYVGDAARATLVFFYSDYEDKITSVLTGDITEDGRWVVASANAGEARLYGLELAGSADLGPLWRVDGSLNWMRGEERVAGERSPADRVPPLNGRLRLRRDWADWRLELVLLFAAEQTRLSARDRVDPRIDPDGTDGWTAVTVRGHRGLGDDWQLSLALENLFDARYREHGSGIDAPGRGIVMTLSRPLES